MRPDSSFFSTFLRRAAVSAVLTLSAARAFAVTVDAFDVAPNQTVQNEATTYTASATPTDPSWVITQFIFQRINAPGGAAIADVGSTPPNAGPNAGTVQAPAPRIAGGGQVVWYRVTVVESNGFVSQTNSREAGNVVVNGTPVPQGAASPNPVGSGQVVTLTGSATDDTGIAAWGWSSLSGGPAPSPASGNVATFTAPAPGTYVYRFTVVDENGAANAVDVAVQVTANAAPSASAGPDQIVSENAPVTLAGSGSDPEDGANVTFPWQHTAGPTVALSNPNAPAPAFTAPGVESDTVLSFTLTVRDTQGAAATDSVSITVRDAAEALPAVPTLARLAIYPSPFNPASGGASIAFDLRNASSVDVAIFDVFGRTVREIHAAGTAGSNVLHWDGKNADGDEVANGAYIVQVRSDDGGGGKGKMSDRVGVRK